VTVVLCRTEPGVAKPNIVSFFKQRIDTYTYIHIYIADMNAVDGVSSDAAVKLH